MCGRAGCRMSLYPNVERVESDPHAYSRRSSDRINRDAAESWAIRQLTGDDCDLTSATFATFMETCGDEQEPVISPKAKPHIQGLISNMDLFKTMVRSDDYAHCAAATFELMARYQADPFTVQNFHQLVEAGVSA